MSNSKQRQNWGTMEDEGLVGLCQKGETEAFGFLVERYQKKVFTMAYRMTGDYEEASEAAQDVFLSAFRSIRSFRRESRFSTWLHTITANVTRNRLKKNRSQIHNLVDSDPKHRDDDPPSSIDTVAASGPSVADLAEARETGRMVQACINRLDPQHREVIILRDIEGIPYDEIGEILALPAGTVKSRLSRARDALRKDLKTTLGDL